VVVKIEYTVSAHLLDNCQTSVGFQSRVGVVLLRRLIVNSEYMVSSSGQQLTASNSCCQHKYTLLCNGCAVQMWRMNTSVSL
jgi:hypothetical protein